MFILVEEDDVYTLHFVESKFMAVIGKSIGVALTSNQGKQCCMIASGLFLVVGRAPGVW